MRLATAFVEVRPDTKNFRSDLKRDTENDVRDVGRVLGQALAGGAFLAGAKRAVDAASDLNEAANVTKITFGAAEDQVASFASTAAESIGQSEAAARSATATFGGLLLNLGYTEQAAADTSIQLTKLASDLGSAFNTDPAEAALALSSALRGEQEPILRYNVLLSDQAVRQKAVALGLAETTAAVDDNGKVQARLALIMEQTSRVQGDFANTSEGAANAQRIAAAQAEDAAADLGENLLPIYERIVAVVGDVANVFGGLPEPVQTAVIALAGIAALSGPVSIAVDAVSSLASITRTALTRGLDTAAVGAYNLSGNLGKVAIGAGALGVALVGASLILDSYQRSKADAAEIEETYTRILTEQTDAIGANTDAFTLTEILKGDLGKVIREAGSDLNLFSEAVRENGGALDDLARQQASIDIGTGEYEDLAQSLDDAGLAGTDLGNELLRLRDSGALTDDQIRTLIDRLGTQAREYEDATIAAENKGAADEAAGTKAGEAAPKIDAETDALDDNEQAAKDAAESVDLFREAVEKVLEPLDFEAAVDAQTQALLDLANDVEDRREGVADAQAALDALRAQRSDQSVADTRRIADAEEALAEARARVADTDSERAAKVQAIADAEQNLARAREDAGGGGVSDQDIADAQQAVADAIAATSTALDGNSEAALRNRETIRDLVNGAVDVIETGREQGKSLEELQLIRQFEIQQLRDQLKALGFTEDQIDDYIAVIEDIPLTKATTITADTSKAEAKIRALLEIINAVPTSIDAAVADRNLQREAARQRRGYAAGGMVTDGLFTVGENGTEVMQKDGSDLRVIAGSPTQQFDGVGEDQLLQLKRQNDLLAQLVANTSGRSDLHRTARAGAA